MSGLTEKNTADISANHLSKDVIDTFSETSTASLLNLLDWRRKYKCNLVAYTSGERNSPISRNEIAPLNM